MSRFNLGQEVEVRVKGIITEMRGDYEDKKVRYHISGGHCVSAIGTDDQIIKKESFEDFLMMKHADQYIGTKDGMIDDFPNWMEDLDLDQWLEYGDQFKG